MVNRIINKSPEANLGPKTKNQKEIVRSILSNDITLVHGPAGTAKTSITVNTLLDLLSSKEIRKIVVVRLIADTFDEHLGALPGECGDKLMPFLGPILDALSLIRTHSQIQRLIELKQIEVIPVSHVRGRSFNDCGIIVEEAQNCSPAMLLACLTRIGQRSKLVLTGDENQADFTHKRPEGISYAKYILEGIDRAGIIELGLDDIVRNDIIKSILRKHDMYMQERIV